MAALARGHGLGLLLLLLSSTAHASPAWRLEFQAPQGCGEGSALQARVEALLGQPAFDDGAERVAHVEVSPQGAGLRATVSLDGAPGERTLHAESRHCEALVGAIALALSVGLEQLRAAVATPVYRDQAGAAAPIAQQFPAPRPPLQRIRDYLPGDPLSLEGHLAASGQGGTAPRFTLGLSLGAGLSQRRWSAIVAFDWVPPLRSDARGGQLRTQLLGARAQGCLRSATPLLWGGRPEGCLLVQAGQLEARGEGFALNRELRSPYVNAGLRASWRQRITGWLELGFFAEAAASLIRNSLSVDGRRAWETPPLMGTVGVSAHPKWSFE